MQNVMNQRLKICTFLVLASLSVGVAHAEEPMSAKETLPTQTMPFPQPPNLSPPADLTEAVASKPPVAKKPALAEDHATAGKKRSKGSEHRISSSADLISGPPTHEAVGKISEMASKGEIIDTNITVLPEVATPVDFSSSDINRISCNGEIKDIVYSKEKGLTVKFTGNNAFVKFLIRKSEEKEVYATLPSEMYIVCGESVYNLIAVPKRIPGRTIRLSNGSMEKIKKNNAAYGAIPFEKKILSILKSVYTDDIPESLVVEKVNKSFPIYQDITITLNRMISVEGEGLRIKEYHVAVNPNATSKFELREKQFLRNDLATKPIAVSIDNPVLKPGKAARVFVFESMAEKNREVEE